MAGGVPERKHQPVLEPFRGELIAPRWRRDALNAVDVTFAGEDGRLVGEAQAFDFLPLAGIQRDRAQVALAVIGAAGTGESGGELAEQSGSDRDCDKNSAMHGECEAQAAAD